MEMNNVNKLQYFWLNDRDDFPSPFNVADPTVLSCVSLEVLFSADCGLVNLYFVNHRRNSPPGRQAFVTVFQSYGVIYLLAEASSRVSV